MIRINLLPHRAEKRRAHQIQFVALSAVSLLLGAVLVGFVHLTISNMISSQERRNTYLKQEITVLDKQIEEIKKLREQTQSLLARKDNVEKLQSDRSDVVHLLDQMLRLLPDGVHLKSLKQTAGSVSVTGFTQSNARVSTLMRAIEDSPWLESPALVEIKASNTAGARLSEFSLTFKITKPKGAEETGKPADKKDVKPAVSPAQSSGAKG